MSPNFDQVIGFIRYVFTRFKLDRCTQVAASLTFTTLLSLVPLITIGLTVIAAFPVFSQFINELKIFLLTNMVPESAGKIITVYMQQFAESAARLTALGIALLAVTAILMMFTIENAFNAIWRVSRPRPLVNRFLVYWAALTLGPVLIGVSLSLTSYLVSLSLGWVAQIQGLTVLSLKLIPVLFTTLAFFLLYLTLPSRYVPRLHALLGGTAAALMFEGMKRIFAFYITNLPTYNLVYGAFASFPIFLLWLYCSWLVILLGAVITAALSHWKGGAWRLRQSPEQQFRDALRVLRVLYVAHQRGEAVNLARLRGVIPLGLDHLEDMLERMADAHLVQKVAGPEYVLSKNPQQVKLADVYRLFVLQMEKTESAQGGLDAELAPILEEISRNVEGSMHLSLDSVFAGASPASAEDVTFKQSL